MLLRIHPETPQERKIKEAADCLKNGGIIIYPTDTVYGIGCDIFNVRAIERVCAIKEIKPEKANLSFVCHDLSHLSDFALPFDKQVYKLMNKNLPGPFTFILNAANTVPKLLRSKRKTVGIRVPDNAIARAIVRELGNPILSASLKFTTDEEDVLEYPTDPEEIYEQYEQLVDIVIDGGYGNNTPSTIVDCTEPEITIVRQGLGELLW
ncbi:threonylcarbamoyl-AMP synthase [Sphingobacteriales bacterium UPWRP_1]|nr:threonylcarbamoyl-AMP synthase [Sphingobacteriales bacterium TSM_CSS]PSJ77286.1 threonylcarbamoyl-AMP synthase [Sphingobacteriales bacterium UPWRP_1]